MSPAPARGAVELWDQQGQVSAFGVDAGGRVPAGGTERRPSWAGRLSGAARRRGEALAYALLGGEFVWFRLQDMHTGLTLDEAFSAVTYIDRGLAGIYDTKLYATNNHVLFEILSWLTVLLLGRHVPNYRLWSVIPAILAAALLVWWTRRRIGRISGLVLAGILLTAPLLLKETTLGRGYGLEQLGMVLLLIGAAELEERGPSRRALATFAAGMFIGPAAQASMIIVVPLVILWLLRRPDLRLPVIWATVGAAVALAIVVGPLVPTMIQIAPKDETGAPPLPLDGLLTGPLSFGAYTGQLLLTGKQFYTCTHHCYGQVQIAAWGWVLYVPALLGIVGLWRWRRRGLLGLLVVMLFGAFALLVVGRIGVNDRFTLYLLPVYALLAATGAGWAIYVLARRRSLRPFLAAAGIGLLLLGTLRINSFNVIDQHVISFPDYQGMADAVSGTGVSSVALNSQEADSGLLWYLPSSAHYMPPLAFTQFVCRHPGPVAAIELKVALTPAEYACLVKRHAASVDFPGRGALLRLWLIQTPGLKVWSTRALVFARPAAHP